MRTENVTLPLRLILGLALASILAACASRPRLSPVEAGTLAARLANDRCQDKYGQKPFHPEDFEAVLEGGRWYWGTREGMKVDGFEADISFDILGRKDSVRVAIPEE